MFQRQQRLSDFPSPTDSRTSSRPPATARGADRKKTTTTKIPRQCEVVRHKPGGLPSGGARSATEAGACSSGGALRLRRVRGRGVPVHLCLACGRARCASCASSDAVVVAARRGRVLPPDARYRGDKARQFLCLFLAAWSWSRRPPGPAPSRLRLPTSAPPAVALGAAERVDLARWTRGGRGRLGGGTRDGRAGNLTAAGEAIESIRVC